MGQRSPDYLLVTASPLVGVGPNAIYINKCFCLYIFIYTHTHTFLEETICLFFRMKLFFFFEAPGS